MKPIFILIFLSSALFSKSVYSISSINQKVLMLKSENDTKNLSVGQSGFVMSSYLDVEYISAIVEIKHIQDNNVLAEIIETNPFKNTNLAYAKKSVNQEDSVVFDLFADNTFLIAPNEDAYNDTKSLIAAGSTKEFLSPEIVLFYLDSSSVDLADIQNIAKEYLIGNVYIAYDNKLVTLDAFSLKILKTKEIKINSSTYTKPFFFYSYNASNVSRLFGNLIPFDYNNHYKKILQDTHD